MSAHDVTHGVAEHGSQRCIVLVIDKGAIPPQRGLRMARRSGASMSLPNWHTHWRNHGTAHYCPAH
jgi:hypothetical protein